MPQSLKPTWRLRPTDLARQHGISSQAVRNYEQDGCLPAATRTQSGYRIYTELHESALTAYLALIPAHGHASAGVIMRALNEGDTDTALRAIGTSHAQLARDRDTLDAVRAAIDELTADSARPDRPSTDTALGIGAVAHRLGLTPATVRTWERAGILAPDRDPATGYRVYRAADLRDAELTHLLRRGGTPLPQIATVVDQVHKAGDTAVLAGSLTDWQQRLIRRGVAMITADRRLADYLDLLGRAAETDIPSQH